MAKSNKETKGTKEEIMSNAELRGHHYAKRIAPKLAEATRLRGQGKNSEADALEAEAHQFQTQINERFPD